MVHKRDVTKWGPGSGATWWCTVCAADVQSMAREQRSASGTQKTAEKSCLVSTRKVAASWLPSRWRFFTHALTCHEGCGEHGVSSSCVNRVLQKKQVATKILSSCPHQHPRYPFHLGVNRWYFKHHQTMFMHQSWTGNISRVVQCKQPHVEMRMKFGKWANSTNTKQAGVYTQMFKWGRKWEDEMSNDGDMKVQHGAQWVDKINSKMCSLKI